MPGQDAGKYNMTVCIERRGNSFDDQHMYILSSVKHYQTDHVLGHKGNLNQCKKGKKSHNLYSLSPTQSK